LLEINTTTHDEYGRKAGGFLAQMEKFSTFFGLKLAHLIFSGSEQLSLTLQGKDITVEEAIVSAKLTVSYLERLRSDTSFDNFYKGVLEASKELTSPPTLPRYRRIPRRVDNGSTENYAFNSPQDYFRRQYFKVLDTMTNELKHHFDQQRGMPIAAMIEKILLNTAANGEKG